MTKRLTSKFHVCKNIQGKHKNLWGVVKSTKFRSVRILKQKVFLINQKSNRLSFFGKLLNSKKCLRRFYCNIQEKPFKTLLIKAEKSNCKTMDKLISFLESRLDTIIYRSCFVNSLYMARQLINHGFVFVNMQVISSANILNPGDLIEINYKTIESKKNLINILKQRHFKIYYLLFLKKTIDINSRKKIVKTLNSKNRRITFLLKTILLKKQILSIKQLTKIPLIPSYLETNFKILQVILLWDPLFKHVYFPVKIKYKKHNTSVSYSYNEILYSN